MYLRLNILHVSPSWVFYMHVPSWAFLHVLPSWVFYKYVPSWAFLHVHPSWLFYLYISSEYFTCISILSILHVSGDMNWRLIILGKKHSLSFIQYLYYWELDRSYFVKHNCLYFRGVTKDVTRVCLFTSNTIRYHCVYLPVTQDVIIVSLFTSNTRRFHCVFIYQ